MKQTNETRANQKQPNEKQTHKTTYPFILYNFWYCQSIFVAGAPGFATIRVSSIRLHERFRKQSVAHPQRHPRRDLRPRNLLSVLECRLLHDDLGECMRVHQETVLTQGPHLSPHETMYSFAAAKASLLRLCMISPKIKVSK
jgi:hypothetical protein